MGNLKVTISFDLTGFVSPRSAEKFKKENLGLVVDDIRSMLRHYDRWAFDNVELQSAEFYGEDFSRYRVEAFGQVGDYVVRDTLDHHMVIAGPFAGKTLAQDVCDFLNDKHEGS